jgi:DNA helicase-2/ATP-dependent DNA helicase PcrA
MMDDVVGKKVYEAYNDGLRALNVLDFDDLLLLTYRLFQERPKIADFYRRQYSYICIDEAQDLKRGPIPSFVCSMRIKPSQCNDGRRS